MAIAVVGANHRTAPIEVRERFAMGRSEAPAVIANLVDADVASEAVLLSTCNRSELYFVAPDLGSADAAFRALLAERVDLSPDRLSGFLYLHRDQTAVRHLFRVAAGLDSMVLGEPQVQGQVREAYQIAQETRGLSGPVVGATLNRLFQTALRVGGRVRTETEVGLGAASVSTAAVELAKKIFGSLKGRNALVVGAGEMSETTLECLRGEGVRSCVVTNRTHSRAVELAERWGGRVVHWDDVGSALKGADIVICSTAAPHPVLSLERFRSALPKGSSNPLCIIDIAIPRDVDPRVGAEPNVFLYNVDDLRQIVDDSLERRQAEVPRAEGIVSAVVDQYWSWHTSLAVVPTIRDLRERGEAVRRAEIEKALKRLGHLSPEDQREVEALTRSILNKLLHSPTVRLRQAAGNGRGTTILDSIRYLFELDDAAGKAADSGEQSDDEGE